MMHKLIVPSVFALSLAACDSAGEPEAPAQESPARESPAGESNVATEDASLADEADATAAEEKTAAEAETPSSDANTIAGITNERVSFSPGTSSATVEDNITGDETIDYLLNVNAGQAMNVSMATKNTAAYFNILEPGETSTAIHVGSTSGNQFEGVAAESGDYRIRVYLMRSAARRNESADYRLEMIVE